MTPQQMELLRRLIGENYYVMSTPLSPDSPDAAIILPQKLNQRELQHFYRYIELLESTVEANRVLDTQVAETETQVGPLAS